MNMRNVARMNTIKTILYKKKDKEIEELKCQLALSSKPKPKVTESDKIKKLKKAHKKEIEILEARLKSVWQQYHNRNRALDDYFNLSDRNIRTINRLEEEASINKGVLDAYKKNLNRALKVESHYHDLVAENRILKEQIKIYHAKMGSGTNPNDSRKPDPKNTPEYKDRLRKLRAIKKLAERGVGGEGEAAKLKLKELSKKYGIPLSDI